MADARNAECRFGHIAIFATEGDSAGHDWAFYICGDIGLRGDAGDAWGNFRLACLWPDKYKDGGVIYP